MKARSMDQMQRDLAWIRVGYAQRQLCGIIQLLEVGDSPKHYFQDMRAAMERSESNASRTSFTREHEEQYEDM